MKKSIEKIVDEMIREAVEDKEIVISKNKCPNGRNQCHYHSNKIRQFAHKVHCYYVRCKYSRK